MLIVLGNILSLILFVVVIFAAAYRYHQSDDGEEI